MKFTDKTLATGLCLMLLTVIASKDLLLDQEGVDGICERDNATKSFTNGHCVGEIKQRQLHHLRTAHTVSRAQLGHLH